MRVIGLLVLLTVVGLLAFIRFAPSDPARWHAMPEEVRVQDLTGGAMRVLERADDATLARLDAVAMETPRTARLAGGIDEGMITYVTRSAVFGFPDYTTVRLTGTRLEIYGRLRFGASDMGVNAARLDGWLQRLGQGG